MKKSVFFMLTKPGDPTFGLIEEVFDNRISVLYNYRCSTLQKLQELDDRYCEIIFVDHQPAGFLIYKKALQEEFGFKHAFELKTLCVFQPEQNARKGLGSLLFQRANILAGLRNASCIYSTVIVYNHAIIACALKNGFEIIKRGQALTQAQREHYPLEVNELLISKPIILSKGMIGGH